LIRTDFQVGLRSPATKQSRACSDASPYDFGRASSGLAQPEPRHAADGQQVPLGGVVAFGVDRAVFLDQLHIAEHGAQRVASAGNICALERARRRSIVQCDRHAPARHDYGERATAGGGTRGCSPGGVSAHTENERSTTGGVIG
jgi:hypothetical protein